MLLLVTIGLVLIGAVSLVIGFVSNSLGPIYLSIACSVIAGIVLVVFSRMARRQEGTASGGIGAAPSPGSWAPSAAPSTPSPPPSFSGPSTPAVSTPPPPVDREPMFRPEPRPMAEPEPRTTRTATFAAARPGAIEEDGGDLDFPIEGYDGLRASQILAELDGLSLDELDMVREREEQGKNRSTVIRRVDVLIDELEAAEGGATPEPAFDEEPELEPVSLEEDDFEEEPEPEPEPEPVAAAPLAASEFAMTSADDADFPIAGYDQLAADEIIAQLDDLSDDELDQVAEREEQGRNRAEILDYIDGMFEEVGPGEPSAPIAPPPPAPVAKKAKAPARKAASKAPTAKKSPAKVAPVKTAGKAAAAGKLPAKKAAGRKAAVKAVAPAPAPAPAPAVKASRVPVKKAAKAAPATVKAVKKAGARTPAAPLKKKAAPATPVEKAKSAVKKVAKAAAKRVPGTKKS